MDKWAARNNSCVHKGESVFDSDCTVHTFQESDPKSRQRIVTPSERWHRQKKIGGGGFGTVWLETCTHPSGTTQSATVRAVKQIGFDSRFGKIDYNRELETIAKFSHSRYEGPSQLFIAIEYLEISDLFTYLYQNPPLPESEAKDIAYQILDGLSMMHQNGFAHRDLKPNNILIKSHPPHEWWIKLADFGITKRIEEGHGQSTTIKGTPRYFAPEIWGFVPRGSAYATDIWALGEIVFEILTERPAFGNLAPLAGYKAQEQFPTNILAGANVCQSGIDFVISLMHPDPEHRVTTTMGMSNVWIQSLVSVCSSGSTIPSDGEPHYPSIDSLTEEFASWNTRPPPDTQDSMTLPIRPDHILQELSKNRSLWQSKNGRQNTTLTAVHDQAETVELSATELSDKFKNFVSLLQSGQLEEAEARLCWLCQAQEKVLPQDHTERVRAIFILGKCVCLRGRCKEAEIILNRALQDHKKVLGLDDHDTLSCGHWLALSIYHQGRFEEAETAYRRSLEGLEAML
ncbi:Tetratricopeptide-like helical [Penicillium cataractarum]|uniref:Tetratricopeptide-like helical n=1 Tax=Penicillium cataractarum TaxID=2100454 RepID=A0A9W9SMV9_9EURO|nr:Tetratricopeptide-like helical [Penicillium cataractarum]KAJ5381227.1 Tetratricopeptide-like helical [Penicillium cataractarum]